MFFFLFYLVANTTESGQDLCNKLYLYCPDASQSDSAALMEAYVDVATLNVSVKQGSSIGWILALCNGTTVLGEARKYLMLLRLF